MAKRTPVQPEPLTRERVLAALRKSGGSAQKRDIARELGIGAEQKKELRHILRSLEEEGALGRTGRKRYADTHALPQSGVMDIIDRDADGELIARMRGPDGLFGPSVRLAPGASRTCGPNGPSGPRMRAISSPSGSRSMMSITPVCGSAWVSA